jgi:AcrR family transcriptional regulator
MTADDTTGERILRAATTCFRRWGVDKTSMGDIAAEAGMRRPQLYRHFESKEALIVETIVRAASELSERRLREIPLEGPAPTVVAEALIMGHEDLVADAFASHLIGNGARTFLRLLAEEPALRASQQRWWSPAIIYGQKRSELRTDLTVDEITDWFLISQISMTDYAEHYPTTESVRYHVTTFIVPAVLYR